MLVKQKVKYIQSLGQKKFRQEEKRFIAEGPKLVEEIISSSSSMIVEIFALPAWITENKKMLGNIPVIEISSVELDRISQLTTPNKVVAIVKQFELNDQPVVRGKIILALDGIRDPGNLGTIIRIADWFGVDQIVCSIDSADIYNPKVVQATMGSIARVSVYYKELKEWISIQKNSRIYATVLDGQDVTKMKKIPEGIIILGNESNGIHDEILQLANVKVTVPKKGKAESLNASVAAGIILNCLT